MFYKTLNIFIKKTRILLFLYLITSRIVDSSQITSAMDLDSKYCMKPPMFLHQPS